MIKVVQKMKELDSQILNNLLSDSPLNLTIRLNDGEEFNVLYEDSPVLSSTAIGYVVESYICKRCLQKSNKLSTNVSSYDLKYEFDDYILLINIKTKTKNSSKSGVGAFYKLLSNMKQLLDHKPVYYYVYEVEYDISEDFSSVVFSSSNYYCLNNYLVDKKIVTDSRSWSKESSAKSGRILIKDFQYSLDDIPTYEQTKNSVCELLSYSDEEIFSLRKRNKKQKQTISDQEVNEILSLI